MAYNLNIELRGYPRPCYRGQVAKISYILQRVTVPTAKPFESPNIVFYI